MRLEWRNQPVRKGKFWMDHAMPNVIPSEAEYAIMSRCPGPVPPWAEDSTLLPRRPPVRRQP